MNFLSIILTLAVTASSGPCSLRGNELFVAVASDPIPGKYSSELSRSDNAGPEQSRQSRQDPQSAEFKARYERQVKAVGPTGLGVETILNKWEEACPDDPDMLEARFNWCFNKASKSTVVPMDRERYLGKKPLLSLPDTTSKGGKRNYFEDTEFDAELFAAGTRSIDKAIRLRPNELRYRFDKISALIAYEKESPDMATEDIRTLIDYNASSKPEWTLDGRKVEKDLFDAAIQEYCFNFFRTASDKSFESFREISEKMLAYDPGNPLFLDNMGSWWLVAKRNDNQALK